MANLERFIKAQENSYNQALNEIKMGEKKTHWMWYIFPQIKGLGFSEISNYYAIEDLDEATAYLENKILKQRLIEISKALLKLETNNPIEIFGVIDSIKLKSSMTIFSLVSNESIFENILEKFYEGEKDEKTIELSKVKQKKITNS
ncbi:MAG: DUF1810 domain-containing protein [Bacilli bacterium]|nr:DUF1810 domain-containing protein [Bacilli bacterium]